MRKRPSPRRSCSAIRLVTSRRECPRALGAVDQHGVAGHQMADIAHQQQRAAGQRQRSPVGRGIARSGAMRRVDDACRPCRKSRRDRPSSGRASCDRPRPCPRHPRRRPNPRNPGSWSAPLRAPRRRRRRGSVLPIGWSRSMWISTCSPLCTSRTALGAEAVAGIAGEQPPDRRAPRRRRSAFGRAAAAVDRILRRHRDARRRPAGAMSVEEVAAPGDHGLRRAPGS